MGSEVQGGLQGWGGWCGAVEGEGSSVATLGAYFLPALPTPLWTADCTRSPALSTVFLVLDPSEPEESKSAHSSDFGCYWRKGRQEGEHVPDNKGVLSRVGTCCEVAFSPLGNYRGLKE